MEVSFELKDARLAFYFMEKSRAVLLNDRLNELGSAGHLPTAEAGEEQSLQIKVYEQQQKAAAAEGTSTSQQEQLKLYQANEDFTLFTKKIAIKYPRYFQYRYANEVPQLDALQTELGKERQTFLEYFINDSAVYTLTVTQKSAALTRQLRSGYNEVLSHFLQTCSNQQTLNDHYESFAREAGEIYHTLFQPLGLPPGRVVYLCRWGNYSF